jgi:MYXO-CTERM domain-containing protein
LSTKLLGRDSSHWAAFVDTDASVMDGWDWEPAGNNFKVVDDMNIFSTLDLYTMGALPVASAKPFFFIDGARYTGIGDPGVDGRNVGATDGLGFGSVSLLDSFGVTIQAEGERVDLTIQDVVNAEGNRCPDPDHTQKTFKQAMVLVTRTGQSAAAAAAFTEELEVVNATWEKWWLERTGRALTLCTGVDTDCLQASATLGGGFLDTPAADGDLVEPGDDITLHVDVKTSGDKVKNAKLVLELRGAGADHAELKKAEIALGDIDVDSEVDVPVEIAIKEDMPCGSPTIVRASIVSDNAPTIVEEYRLFPGYDQVFFESFGKSDDFEVDNSDAEAESGLERIDVQLTCDITPRTPERDASPANAGAYVTGASRELSGNANLLSPTIDLRGTIKPQIRFNYWLDGDGFLLVELSKDGGDSFVDAIKYEKTAHEWQLGFVDIIEELGSVPDELVIRFTFQSRDGEVEGGIDEVRVLARAGQCAGFLGCGCSANGDSSPAAAVFAALGLLALRAARRRRRRG